MKGLVRWFPVAVLTACAPQLPGEGEVCSDSCQDGLACVVDVGADHGKAATDNICERPHAMYDMVAFGERGENRRVDETLDMIEGTFRMPRFADSDPSLDTVPHTATLADGTELTCTGLARADEHPCLVPDWAHYYGDQISQYDRFIFYGLRMESSLLYTAFYSPTKRLQQRYYERTHKNLDEGGVNWLRREARSLALATIDSFVAQGHRTYALDRMPACYAGASGYQNPNASWAPVLNQWDPGMRIDGTRLDQAEDVPADCTGTTPYTYYTLRFSLWYPHASAYRAMMLTNAYFLFRGMLSDDQRAAWLRVVRETGDALALPSSYEPNQNHGITESAALLELGNDFAELLPPDVTAAWGKLGRYRFNDVMVDTVFADGVQVEQSPMYHNYELALLIQILDWLEAHDADVTTDIDPALRVDYDSEPPAPAQPDVNQLSLSTTLDSRAVIDNMVRASIHLAQPDGWIPWIGSSVPQQYRGYEDDVLDRYIQAHRPFAEQLRFYRTAGAKGTAPPNSERLAVFADSGFVTIHSGFYPNFAKQTHVVFDTGLPYHKHSHPDVLSVHLFGPDTAPGAKTGTPLLVDSGWYSYESTGTFFFKSTLAHNTVNVDGKNQCVRQNMNMRLDPYVDGALPSCSDLAAIDPAAGAVRRGLSLEGKWNGMDWFYQSALHTLYLGTTHRRGVLLIGREILVVVDMLDSNAPHTFSQTWHLTPRVPAPASAPAGDGGTYHLQFARSEDDSAPLMSLHEATDGAELQLHYGEPAIAGIYGQGWYSVSEEHADPNLVVELRRSGVTSTAFASVFLLGSRAGHNADVALRRDGSSAGSLAITLDGKTISIDIQHLADANAETVQVY